MINLNRMLTVSQAAARLKMHRRSLNRAIREQRIRAFLVGHIYLLDPGDVTAFSRRYTRRMGRPPGRKDSYPRTRRTRAEMAADAALSA